MNLYNYEGVWYTDGYMILGDEEEGYVVRTDDGAEKIVYRDKSFERCLFWLYQDF